MFKPDKIEFLKIWPRCFIAFMGFLELACVLMFFLTELCNVAANFWTTNVFAGGWCGLVMLVHSIALIVAGTCKAGPKAAFRAAIITIVAIAACLALIVFDIIFIADKSMCILTSSCSSNAVSTTIFSYTFQQDFFNEFNSLSPFQSYTQNDAKLLCQAIQLGVGVVCLVDCIVYLIIYYVTLNKLKKQGPVVPIELPKKDDYNELEESTISPMPTQQSSHALSPTAINPQPVYTVPQQTFRPAYPVLPQPQQAYVIPQPQQAYAVLPQPQQAYAVPRPQAIYYAPPPKLPPPPQPMYYVPPARPQYDQPVAPAWRPDPRIPQVQPGVIPWNSPTYN